MNGVQADLTRGTVAEVKQLTVERLKRILRSEGLTVGGLKNELQQRLITTIYDCDRRGDHERIRLIRDAVRGASYNSASNMPYNPNPYPSPYSSHTPASSASPQYYASPTPRLPPPPTVNLNMPGAYSGNRVTFKNSPFYTIQKQLSNVVELKIREATRDTAKLSVNLDATLAAKFQSDTNTRAMVFCAAESFDSSYKPVDIAFPPNSELKCNQEGYTGNLKGLKNKAGSTRPADITAFLRKRPGYPNTIELMYALTSKDPKQKFFLLVNMVQRRPIHTLVEDIRGNRVFTKDRVIREMQTRAKDDDIVATSSNMSLKDPVQMTRIQSPCRSMNCKHNECFDATVYLNLQEQAPTWTCPICNRPAQWEQLVFDYYVKDILDNTHEDTEQVTIEPDGKWHLIKNEETQGNDNPIKHQHDSDDDDDLVEIVDPNVARSTPAIRSQTSQEPRTPSINGGSFSIPQRPSSAALAQSLNHGSIQSNSQSRKRPREEVIDLTLDDDDEPPPTRVKYSSLSSQTTLDALDRPGGAGEAATFRFNLPQPERRTDSPGRYYEFDKPGYRDF